MKSLYPTTKISRINQLFILFVLSFTSLPTLLKAATAQKYLGIPYAQPPLGNLRWKPPQPVLATQSMLGKMPPPCLQPGPIGTTPLQGSSEDCLYLNIWVPPQAISNSNLPVMVFIHGGGLMVGSTSELDFFKQTNMYDGENLAVRGGVIVVTLQYRLGLLGYLAHPALSNETSYHGSGNYGFMDQAAAIKWVSSNIAKYGGNPRNITLFGESGGAVSTCTLFASPLTQGTVARAIVESGGCNTADLAQSEKEGTRWLHELANLKRDIQCPVCNPDDPDVMSCMRRLPSSCVILHSSFQMLDENNFGLATYKVVVDNHSLLENPYLTFSKAGFNKPIIVGNNANEGALFTPFLVPTKNVFSQLASVYGTQNQQKTLSLYPLSQYGSQIRQAEAIEGDFLISCPSRHVAASLNKAHSPSVFRYRFNYAIQNGSNFPAIHTAELPFVFQNVGKSPKSHPSQSDLKLERYFLAYWTNFAKRGNPNSTGNPTWSAFQGAKDNYLQLESTVQMGGGYHGSQCDFYDQLQVQFGFNY